MHAATISKIHILRPHQGFRVKPVSSTRFASAGGTLWLTQEGVAGDVILKPGESWQAVGEGLVVVQSMGGRGRIRVDSPVDLLERTIAARALQSKALGDAIAAAARLVGRVATRWLRTA